MRVACREEITKINSQLRTQRQHARAELRQHQPGSSSNQCIADGHNQDPLNALSARSYRDGGQDDHQDDQDDHQGELQHKEPNTEQQTKEPSTERLPQHAKPNPEHLPKGSRSRSRSSRRQ